MATFKEAERAGWTQKAGVYDEHFAPVASQAVGPILDRLGDITGLTLLDICCGTGDFSAAAQRCGAWVTGLDFAPTMIAIAAEKVPQATFVTGDAESLEFEDDKFDVAVCSFGLWHVSEPDRTLRETARALKSNGRFVYTTWLPPTKGFDLFQMVVEAVQQHGTMQVDLPPAPPPFRFADEDEAVDALSAQGFHDVAYEEHEALWSGHSGQDVLDLIYKGIVRTPMMIEAQSPDAREAIKKQIVEKSEAMRQRDGIIRMRFPYCLVFASRP